jgi:hypothetical protein
MWALCGFVENENEKRTWGNFINPFHVVVVFFGGDEACF